MNTRYDERWREKAPGRSLILAGRLLVVLAMGAALVGFGLVGASPQGFAMVAFLAAAVLLAVGGGLWATGHDQARPATRSSARVYRL